ncbi:MarR family transcriptional regulator [Lactobacillus sp. PV037]|uniref:MarR family winged helix-turn-helix transcriptional regulator n=1 Tax=unclassified Lactobacillus TaxID=2620435 RepID=UPI0022407FBB|nr:MULTISPECIES: MarR family transcriptional regulator [unclassified Lactobacillus]QNQ82629.1 MarR family transcriptional regulator [Lactobacillus sp. PV012]QNQ83258.1 MarR family transcriptional regulator [Lactobacillus sp. PV037]
MVSKKEKFEKTNRLFRLYMRNTQRIYNAYGSKLHLTSQQARSIAYINRNPGLIQRELGEKFHVRNASVTNMLKNLERDGFIERKKDKDSARIKRIYLTDKGKNYAQEIESAFTKINDQFLKQIDEHDLDMLNEAMTHLIDDLEKMDVDFERR